ncbi:hypothetical protein Tco_1474532 [Tanacetum coccineum]
MPRGTTQRVTRGASNDWCPYTSVRGTVAVRGVSTRQYEVLFRWRLDQSDGDTWHWRVSVRGTVAVSTRIAYGVYLLIFVSYLFIGFFLNAVEFLSYACIDSVLLTLLCCDDIHEVTPRVSALAGCDRLVSEPLVIEK